MIENSLSENRGSFIMGLRWTQATGTGPWNVFGELVYSFKFSQGAKACRLPSLTSLDWLQAKNNKLNKHLGQTVPRRKDVAYMGWGN